MEHSLLVHSEFFIHLFLFGNEDMDRGLVVFSLFMKDWILRSQNIGGIMNKTYVM